MAIWRRVAGRRQRPSPRLLAIAASVGGWVTSCALAAPITDHLNDEYLNLNSIERAKLEQAQAAGLIEIAPLALPEGGNVINQNDHFGWPIAAISGDDIVVAFQRNRRHEWPPNQPAGAAYVRSTDAGQTWSSPVAFPAPQPTGAPNGGMWAIGTNAAGEIVFKDNWQNAANRASLISADGGATWTSYPNAMAGLQSDVQNYGPSIVNHPEFGMLMFNGKSLEAGQSNAFIRQSSDGGRSFTDVAWTPAGGAIPIEPEALVFDNNILLVTREWNTGLGRSDGRYYNHTMHLYRYEDGDTTSDIEFETIRTNVRGNLFGGIWANDTAGLSLNPANGRIELLQSHRYGGGLGDTGENQDIHKSSLNLWSIDPQQLLSGGAKWRFDGTLLERNDIATTNHLDGLHPGAPVVDAVRGKEHIFVYSGTRDRAGIFQYERTLDTERLSRYLKDEHASVWQFEQGTAVDSTGYELNGTINGAPTRVAGAANYGGGAESALRLTGGPDRAEFADGGANDFYDFDADDSFTIETVFKTDQHGSGGSAGSGVLAAKVSSQPNQPGWWLRVEDGKLRFATNTSGSTTDLTTDQAVNDNQWHHAAAVRHAGEDYVRIYLNHQLVAITEDLAAGSLTNNANLQLGASAGENQNFVGDLDFFKVSREALHPDAFLKPTGLRGDVNFDGAVDDADQTLVQSYLGKTSTDLGTYVGDFDQNGSVDAADVAVVNANLGTGQRRLPVSGGLLVELDGSDVTTNGASVISWNDRSAIGGANNAVLAGGNPTRVNVQMPSGTFHEVIDFDGAGDSLRIAADEDFDSREFSWFLVMQPDELTAPGTVMRSSYDDRGDGLANNTLWGTYVEADALHSHSRSDNGGIRAVSTADNLSDWFLLSAIWNAEEELAQFINGEAAGSLPGATADPFFHLGTWIGANSDAALAYDGRIAEILIYDRALSDFERITMETTLADKYGLVLGDVVFTEANGTTVDVVQSAADLDLEGEFKYAFDFFGQAPTSTIGDATFEAVGVQGVAGEVTLSGSLNSWYVDRTDFPGTGTVEDQRLETISDAEIWADATVDDALLLTLHDLDPYQVYKAQFLFNERAFGGQQVGARVFNLLFGDETVVADLDVTAETGGWPDGAAGPDSSLLVTHYFTTDSLGSDVTYLLEAVAQNPFISGFTLETVLPSTYAWTTIAADEFWSNAANWASNGQPAANWDAVLGNESLPFDQTAVVSSDSIVNSITVGGAANALTVHVQDGVSLLAKDQVQVNAQGVVRVDGELTAGTLHVDAGGTIRATVSAPADQAIGVNGEATIAAGATLYIDEETTPLTGAHLFSILQADADGSGGELLGGTFDTVVLPGDDGLGRRYSILYENRAADGGGPIDTVKIGLARPGDADFNSVVDALDLFAASPLFGTTVPASWREGNWNDTGVSQGIVDAVDLIEASPFLNLTYGGGDLLLAGDATTPGQTSDGNPSVIYDFTSGEVLIDTDGTTTDTYVLDSLAGIFSAAAPNFIGGTIFQTANDFRMAENFHTSLTGVHNLGPVAQPLLSQAFLLADLTLLGGATGQANFEFDLVLRNTPEPSTLVLLVLGLAGLAGLARRRR